MRRLYLLRHAKSSWDDPSLPDHDRPLAKRGRKASAAIAAHLEAEGVAPDLVLCSTAVRAVETLERIRPGFAGRPHERLEGELYGAGTADLIERIREVPAEIGSLMLIGHNPSMQQLTVALSGDHDEALERAGRKFPTAALATLEMSADWHDLIRGGAKLIAFVRPKDL